MKRYIVTLLFIAVAGGLIGWGLFRAYRAFKASMEPTACVCDVSPQVSEETMVSLQARCNQLLLEKKETLAKVAQTVCQEFPQCSSIVCRQQPSGMVQVRVVCDDLLCAVNDDLLMTQKGVIVPTLAYAEHEITGLPRLRMAIAQNGVVVAPSVISFIKQIPALLLSSHTIDYRSDDEILLVDSDTTKPVYVCAVGTIVDNALLSRCEKVIRDTEQQVLASKKKARTALVLDLRFDKQIILYPYMGGQSHG